MAVTMAEITKLRNLTSAGLMDCKKALAETDGDIEAAVEILRKKGQAVAAKREDRQASEGCVIARNNGSFAAILALNCETDFVAKNAGFVALANKLMDLAMANKFKTVEDLKAFKVDGLTVADLITEESGKTGEKTEIGAYEIVEAPSTAAYNHFNNKLAAIVGDGHAHKTHKLHRVDALLALGDGDGGALIALDLLGHDPGGTGMEPHGIGDGVLELFH